MAPRKTRKAQGRRVRRRNRANLSGGLVVNRITPTVPDRMILKMRYRDNKTLNLTGDTGYFDFRLNSIYDPDVSMVTGHQPLGYDQWAAFYSRYRVFRADVKATFVNKADTTSYQVGLIPFNAQSTPDLDDSMFEQPHAVSRLCSTAAGMNKAVVRKSFDLPRIIGKSHLQYKTVDNVAASFGTNPTQEIWVRMVADAIDTTASVVNVEYLIEITYHVELFDRTKQSISVPDYKEQS